MVGEESEDLLDLLVQWENLDHQVGEVYQDLMDLLDQRARLETEANQVPWDQRGNMVMWEGLVCQDCRV